MTAGPMTTRREELVQLAIGRFSGARDHLTEMFNNPAGTRTRHFVLDDFLPESTTYQIYQAFPRTTEGLLSVNSFRQRKKVSVYLSYYDSLLEDVTSAFQDQRVVELVGQITGMRGLEADPRLHGGGISIVSKGNFANPHIDHPHDGQCHRYRRLNVLFYVSPEWTLENGGAFELWDDKIEAPKIIVSRFNRVVVMETNRTSWHSVSKVLVDQPRCSVYNYYFSEYASDDPTTVHVSLFYGRPEQRFIRALSPLDNDLRNMIRKMYKRTTPVKRR